MKLFSPYLLLFGVFLWAGSARGQAYVSGRVKSGQTPAEGVLVAVPALGKATWSDSAGAYRLGPLPTSLQTLRIGGPGFRDTTFTYLLQAGENILPTFSLREDGLNLDQVVVTGTRSEVRLQKAPVVVNVLDQKLFATTQSVTLSEGLRFAPGLRLENNCNNCGFTSVRMNGLDGPYTQILVNSRPVFSALNAVYGLEQIPANMIERVEVIRGGGSSLYGGNAIAGTINIITRDPLENSWQASLQQGWMRGGTPDRTLTAHTSVVRPDGQAGLSLFAMRRDRQPWDANNDALSELTKLENTALGLNAFYKVGVRSRLALSLQGLDEFRRGGGDFERPPHQASVAEQLRHRVSGGNLSFETASADQNRRFSAYLAFQRTLRDSYYGAGGRIIPPGDTLTEADRLALNAYGTSEDRSTVGGVMYVQHLPAWNTTLTSGTELQANQVEDRMPGYERAINQTVRTWGSYAQLEWKPAPSLSLIGGMRHDRVQVAGNTRLAQDFSPDQSFRLPVWVPRLAALWQASEDWKLRASYAQGYRAPQAFDEDLHIQTVGGAARFIRLSPNLQAERSQAWTASVDFTRWLDHWQLNIISEGFYTALERPFLLSDPSELPNGSSVVEKRNGAGAWVAGTNTEIRLAHGRSFYASLGATWQQARYNQNEILWQSGDTLTQTRDMLRTPSAYGYWTANWKPTARWTFSYSGNLTGPMSTPYLQDKDSEYTVLRRTPTFVEHNLKLAYVWPLDEDLQLELFAGVYNLGDAFQRDFDRGPNRDASYVYGPLRPRTVYLGIRVGNL